MLLLLTEESRMTTTTFDPVAYKPTTTDQWRAAAQAWHDWSPVLEAWLGEATERMLDLARLEPGSRVLDVAAGAGGQSIAADVEAGHFDAAISRLGLIYLPDRGTALRGIHRALRPGGRIAAILYSTADRNQFFSVPVTLIRERAQLPPPVAGQPGPFSLGAPGVLEGELGAAGFTDITVESSSHRFASTAPRAVSASNASPSARCTR